MTNFEVMNIRNKNRGTLSSVDGQEVIIKYPNGNQCRDDGRDYLYSRDGGKHWMTFLQFKLSNHEQTR